MKQNYKLILDRILEEIQPFLEKGEVANYIPALANVDKKQFAMSVHTVDGFSYSVGDYEKPFSIQSISKVFTLTLAMKKFGDEIWKRVKREPSGTAFNSLVQLEYENGIPRNPFINAGAIVITDSIFSNVKDTTNNIVQFVRNLVNNQNIQINFETSKSEQEYGHRNMALASLMKSFNNLNNNINQVLEVYFNQCSIEMNCKNLSKSFLYLANKGVNPLTNEQVITIRQTKRINALMLTCGLYDSVGDFAYRVGLPGKSGVGGGIVAVIPGTLSVAVWSPGLNKSGNSFAGTKALELFTTYGCNSIF